MRPKLASHRLVPADLRGCRFAGPCSWSAFGALSARLHSIPAAPLLLPLGLGIALQDAGLLTIELPPWLLAVSYAIVGWSTGPFGFNPHDPCGTLRSRCRASSTSILVLMAVCGGLALDCSWWTAGIDPLTAYLATSPGGANSAAIIAMASNVDVAFVMAMQTTRLVLVSTDRPQPRRFHRQAGGRVEAEPVSSPPHYMRVPAEGPQLAFQ